MAIPPNLNNHEKLLKHRLSEGLLADFAAQTTLIGRFPNIQSAALREIRGASVRVFFRSDFENHERQTLKRSIEDRSGLIERAATIQSAT